MDCQAAFQQNSDGYVRKLRRMEAAVRSLLTGIGEDVNREGLRDTPKRVAKALISMTDGYRQDPARLLNQAFFNEPIIEDGVGGLVLVRDIDFACMSQDTLLPFYGKAHIAYVPSDGVVLGLSKLARLTKLCAKQLQSQESLARHVLHVLQAQLAPQGAVVVVQARHLSYTAAKPPQQQIAAAASGCLAATAADSLKSGAVSLEEALVLLGLPVDTDNVQLIPNPATLLLCGPGGCICSSSSSNSCSGACAGCGGSSRLAPHVLRGISASAGGLDSPRAPVTPDPSENDDTDSSEQGSDLYCQQLLGSNNSICRCDDAAADAEASDSMESAMLLLLAEAGVDIVSPVVQTAVRRYVLALLAATSGYHMQPPRSSHAMQQQVQLEQQIEQLAVGVSCPCCSSSREHTCSTLVQQQQHLESVQEASAVLDLEQQQCQWFEHHVPFMSQCEHHMLPFHGTVHIAYLLKEGTRSGSSSTCSQAAAAQERQQLLSSPLSAREAAQLVNCYTRRLQVQERITHQVAAAVQQAVQPAGVMVAISAVHMCMVARGVENHAGSTSTRAAFGLFERDSQLRCKFLRALQQQQPHASS